MESSSIFAETACSSSQCSRLRSSEILLSFSRCSFFFAISQFKASTFCFRSFDSAVPCFSKSSFSSASSAMRRSFSPIVASAADNSRRDSLRRSSAATSLSRSVSSDDSAASRSRSDESLSCCSRSHLDCRSCIVSRCSASSATQAFSCDLWPSSCDCTFSSLSCFSRASSSHSWRTWKQHDGLNQEPPNYGPRVKSGPRSHFIRPAKVYFQ